MIDSELIKRCQSGDEEAFNSLYRSVYKKAVWTACLICGNMDRSEDIVQEACYECFRDIGKLQKAELFQAWFNRILVRKCYKHMKKKFSIQSLDDDEAPELKDDINVADIAETNQAHSQVREAVERLSTPLRTTVILFYYNELSIREIAQAMNCLQGTVKSRLHYAKKKLSRELDENFDPVNRLVQVSESTGGKAYE